MTTPLDLTRATKGAKVAADGFARIDVDAAAWSGLAHYAAAGGADLISLWADDEFVRMALRDRSQALQVLASLKLVKRAYPSVGRHHSPALRLERTARDLYGVEPVGLPDPRRWLDHGVWPRGPGTTRNAVPGKLPVSQHSGADYAFLPVEGPSLHQIPVGPVHAGIIEPGHFRFTASGELIVRLEQRLGYVHKGIEALAVSADIENAARLVGRISGDSTVAYAFAFALAIEAGLGWKVPPRAIALRAVMAEIERIANHVGDVGAICNDASVVAIQARCALIREEILATTGRCFDHRLMMDGIVPGGVSIDPTPDSIEALRALTHWVSAQFEPVVKIYDGMASLQDRTVTTGVVTQELASRYAAGGYVGRASGRAFDARAALRYAPYDTLSFEVPVRSAGDVDARLWIRVEEIRQSLAIVRVLLDGLPAGSVRSPRPAAKPAPVDAAASVEAFRGDVFVWVRLDASGRIARLHARDPSWFQWPLLEAAIEGNIVADFPLCNKSFNCSYSGHDL